MAMPICEDCGNGFSAKDPRGRSKDFKKCPVCMALMMGGAYWVVKNDCNGPFSVHVTYEDAKAELAKYEPFCECYIAAVALIEVPKEKEAYYHSCESERRTA
jgi:hypothetical protein